MDQCATSPYRPFPDKPYFEPLIEEFQKETMRKNPTEAIIDKDNHLRDALKYLLLSLPSPSERPKEMRREQVIRLGFENGTDATLGVQMTRFDAKEAENAEPVPYRPTGCHQDQQ